MERKSLSMKKSLRKCLATYSISNSFEIEILSIDYCNNAVIWKWSDNEKEHSSKYKDIAGKLRFRANRTWIALDDCM